MGRVQILSGFLKENDRVNEFPMCFEKRLFPHRTRCDGHQLYLLLYVLSLQVVRALEKALNFSVQFTRPSDGEMWGWEQENGSWTGLMGDLQRRKADIGVADLYIMEQYFTIIDMSVGTGLQGYVVAVYPYFAS